MNIQLPSGSRQRNSAVYFAHSQSSRVKTYFARHQESERAHVIVVFSATSADRHNVLAELERPPEVVSLPSYDIATIGQASSALVFLVCLASLVLGALSSFHAIFPPMGLLGAGMSALLYFISWRLSRQWRH